MEEISAKTILAKSKHSEMWFGGDYNINLYKGCCHGCIYCDSRSSCYRVENFDTVRVKKNCLLILDRELYKKKQGVVAVGAMSDSYNPFERDLRITRGALELLDKYNFGLHMTTKSDLLLEDLDLIKKINSKAEVNVSITITTYLDSVAKLIEPNVSSSTDRFKIINKLSANGIYCGVIFSPMLPFITDNEDNVRNMVRLAYENGASYIYTFYSVTLRDNQREYYFDKIDKIKFGLSDKYKAYFNEKYVCTSLDSKRLQKVFVNECEKYGLFYTMEDIINGYRENKDVVQLSLF
jgi:DNA repair photolyase